MIILRHGSAESAKTKMMITLDSAEHVKSLKLIMTRGNLLTNSLLIRRRKNKKNQIAATSVANRKIW